jgi:ribosomal protein L21
LCVKEKVEAKVSPTKTFTQKFKADKYKRRKQKQKKDNHRLFGKEDMI